MTVTVPTIRFKFPEFHELADEQVGLAIQEAQLVIDSSWPAKYQDLATAYYTAHLLMVSLARAESGTGQIIKSESIGPMSVTYDTQAKASALDVSELDTTPYGARVLELMEMLFPTGIVI